MPGTGLSLPIPIAGICPVTTIDYPGKIAAVFFTQGCPYRCPYCHNEDLQKTGQGAVSGDEALELAKKRKGLLEAIVISGGEPTIHTGLPKAAETLKSLGFLVGLHTAGASPKILGQTLPFLDWVGLDFKTSSTEKYRKLTGNAQAFGRVLACLDLLQESKKTLQVRTTFFPGQVDENTAQEIDEILAAHGAGPTVRQAYRTHQKTLTC